MVGIAVVSIVALDFDHPIDLEEAAMCAMVYADVWEAAGGPSTLLPLTLGAATIR